MDKNEKLKQIELINLPMYLINNKQKFKNFI